MLTRTITYRSFGDSFIILLNFNDNFLKYSNLIFFIPPVYEVYRGYIVFAFSVCLCVCKLFSVKAFSGTT